MVDGLDSGELGGGVEEESGSGGVSLRSEVGGVEAGAEAGRAAAELAEGGRAWKVTDMVVVRARLEVSRDLKNRSIPKSRNT